MTAKQRVVKIPGDHVAWGRDIWLWRKRFCGREV